MLSCSSRFEGTFFLLAFDLSHQLVEHLNQLVVEVVIHWFLQALEQLQGR